MRLAIVGGTVGNSHVGLLNGRHTGRVAQVFSHWARLAALVLSSRWNHVLNSAVSAIELLQWVVMLEVNLSLMFAC